jgi:hypothetical protein
VCVTIRGKRWYRFTSEYAKAQHIRDCTVAFRSEGGDAWTRGLQTGDKAEFGDDGR